MSLFLAFNKFRLEYTPEKLGSMEDAAKAKLERQSRQLQRLSDEERHAGEDITSKWEEFRAAEPSKGEEPGRLEHLLAPGGNENADMVFVLHYPSFTTYNHSNATVYDPTNPCIRRLVRSGFTDVTTRWLDRFCRRKTTLNSDGSRFQPSSDIEAPLLEHHHDWLETCLKHAAARVMVVTGGETRDYFLKKYKGRMEKVELCGEFEKLSLYLLATEDDPDRLERVVLFVWHPEHVGRGFGIVQRGATYDAQLALAAQLAGIERTPKQIEHNKVSLTPGQGDKEYTEEETAGDKYATIRRKKNKTNNADCYQSGQSREVVCRSCRYPRLDISPLYLQADDESEDRYVSPYTHCPAEGKDKTFVPIDGTPFVTRDDRKRKNESDSIIRRPHKLRRVAGVDYTTGNGTAGSDATL